MSATIQTIGTVREAAEFFAETMRAHPERDRRLLEAALAARKPRRYAVLGLNHLGDPEDTFIPTGEMELPAVNAPATPEGDLARQVVAMLEPLKMLNPVAGSFGLGRSTGTNVMAFGIPLDPAAQDTPAFTRTLEEILAEPAPDPETAGMMPQMKERIALIKENVPAGEFTINLPDAQGPFNLAMSMIGEEALYAPYEEPEKFHALLERITTFWIETRRVLMREIGEEFLAPLPKMAPRIAECSCNLISRATYEEHVLPHDRRIAEAFGAVRIHPCSGPHVFHATLDNLPKVIGTEAGWIAQTTAGAISVEEALDAIGGREIELGIGQELPEGREEEFIQRDLDRYGEHPLLTFGYTGMHWRKKDRAMIREMHRRLDAYWEERYARGGA